MEDKTTKTVDDKELVRIDKKVVERVRKLKKKTGVPIGKFFEIAAEEKLKSENK